MSQHDMTIADGTGAAVLADLNLALPALASCSKGPAAPTTPYAGQLWLDDDTPSSTVWTLKQYDGTDWISLLEWDTTNNAVNWVTYQSANVASAATLNLDTAYGLVTDVTGTTAITAVTLSQGRMKIVRFTGALTLTNGANLVLPGGANITTSAGDYAIFVGYASSVVRCVGFFRANGTPAAYFSGQTIQSVSANYTDYQSFTTTIPGDNTIPQNTEGTQILSASITPKYSTSKLRVRVTGFGTLSAAGHMAAAVFRDSTANAIGATAQRVDSAGLIENVTFEFEVNATATTATTLALRIGPTGAVTMYTNGDHTARLFGGIAEWRMVVSEIAA